MESFDGFHDSLFGFFEELSQNNNREWFTANKERFRNDVVAPMCAFIAAIGPRLADISEQFVADPRPNGGSMFRIYRDVRFSGDKRPYKIHAACQFRHAAGRDVHAPGFYVHLEPGKVFYGGGIWMPPSDVLARIRTAISRRADAWQAVLDEPAFKSSFDGVTGEALVRPPRGYAPDHVHIADIKRKTFFVGCDEDQRAATRPDFLDRVATSFAASRPFMAFLCDAVGVAF